MHAAAPIVPLQKSVVLLGAGNAHLRFVKMFGMAPVPGVAVTLVSEATVIPSSAMVPGCVADDYSRDEITIDLVRLCRAANVRFVAERATGVDAATRTVAFAARPELKYDVLSFGVGSAVARPAGFPDSDSSWAVRPLGQLLDRLDALGTELQQSARPFHVAIVGGGAGGWELAVAVPHTVRQVVGVCGN